MDYQTFRKVYEEQHPASVPRFEVEMHEYPAWVRWAVLATFISAALVSGVHTVPTVWASISTGEIVTPAIRNLVSVMALVAVEFAILLSAYLMAKGVRLAYAVVAIGSAVAIMANLYSVVTAFNEQGNGGALLVAVVLGIGAPLIALFTGKMFVDIHRADRVQDARARKVYRDQQVAWDKDVEKAFKAFCKQGGFSPILSELSTVQMSNSRPMDTSNGQYQPSASTLGHHKTPDASKVVEQYFTDNPGEIDVSPRVLAQRLGVGKSTVNNVQRRLRGQGLTNGHSTDGFPSETIQ